MFDAYREHLDHLMGEASEQQNAFSVSCMTRQPDDKAKIIELVGQGRFVLIAWNVEFCRHTDAALPGLAEHYVADFATRDEANAALKNKDYDGDGEQGYAVVPAPPYQPRNNDNEIPF